MNFHCQNFLKIIDRSSVYEMEWPIIIGVSVTFYCLSAKKKKWIILRLIVSAIVIYILSKSANNSLWLSSGIVDAFDIS